MDIFTIIGVASLGASSLLVIYANNQNARNKTKDDNLRDLLQRVEILEKEREYARQQHIENQKAIAGLEGQLKTYKDIPLKEIADSLKNLALSEKNIIAILNENARIAQEALATGGVLVRNERKKPLNVKEVKE